MIVMYASTAPMNAAYACSFSCLVSHMTVLVARRLYSSAQNAVPRLLFCSGYSASITGLDSLKHDGQLRQMTHAVVLSI